MIDIGRIFQGKEKIGQIYKIIKISVSAIITTDVDKLDDGTVITNEDFDIKYDRDAIEVAIQKEILKMVEKKIHKKINRVGGNALIGFPSSMTTRKGYQY